MHAPLDCDHIEAKNVCAMEPKPEERSYLGVAAAAVYLGDSGVKPLKPYTQMLGSLGDTRRQEGVLYGWYIYNQDYRYRSV